MFLMKKIQLKNATEVYSLVIYLLKPNVLIFGSVNIIKSSF